MAMRVATSQAAVSYKRKITGLLTHNRRQSSVGIARWKEAERSCGLEKLSEILEQLFVCPTQPSYLRMPLQAAITLFGRVCQGPSSCPCRLTITGGTGKIPSPHGGSFSWSILPNGGYKD